mmetsp:Transcript_45157/g.98188  ORF Transcript_45157/g.98188 Transcript_45157/m.98188 type:complete len:260 (+) Transcript_45157:84-863(+)|eukprot:CAMPEP_0170607190 /NCGR_PEP_ID=MMETSP0224-20130122/20920_1 /TAXON_ID=285029 /ORGANISM="Togula jolla, Strain CCCM 725" /LENGTH=259 /DNA_ID=CAMNT_0010932335 /DNA_START=79 /DNA_END=858 /DNA_ORIENTATION=-
MKVALLATFVALSEGILWHQPGPGANLTRSVEKSPKDVWLELLEKVRTNTAAVGGSYACVSPTEIMTRKSFENAGLGTTPSIFGTSDIYPGIVVNSEYAPGGGTKSVMFRRGPQREANSKLNFNLPSSTGRYVVGWDMFMGKESKFHFQRGPAGSEAMGTTFKTDSSATVFRSGQAGMSFNFQQYNWFSVRYLVELNGDSQSRYTFLIDGKDSGSWQNLPVAFVNIVDFFSGFPDGSSSYVDNVFVDQCGALLYTPGTR